MQKTSDQDNLDDKIREHIAQVLVANNWNKSRASKRLGISRRSLLRRIAKYHIYPIEPED